MYLEKFTQMLREERNIPFTKEEVEEMPLGFTPTSIKDNPYIGMFTKGNNKFIPISRNRMYHQKSIKLNKEAA